MLTTTEIKKLSNYLLEVFKEVFATKEDIKELVGKIDQVQNSVDNIAKIANDHC